MRHVSSNENQAGMRPLPLAKAAVPQSSGKCSVHPLLEDEGLLRVQSNRHSDCKRIGVPTPAPSRD
ncbi:hypothetical protein MCOR12_005327 [Pyricularia oryzae]|nr:hypothetical protein MCOR09_006679 [Pyricularia oryzae]KAI6598591.1 hypothetical protein MCOR12_005327 [Pyricularia oryzae]